MKKIFMFTSFFYNILNDENEMTGNERWNIKILKTGRLFFFLRIRHFVLCFSVQ